MGERRIRETAEARTPAAAVLLAVRREREEERRAVAAVLGLQEQDLYRWETGVKVPPEVFARLLAHYRMSPDEFLERFEAEQARMQLAELAVDAKKVVSSGVDHALGEAARPRRAGAERSPRARRPRGAR